MSGRLIYLIGPSGAGKDTMLRWLREHAQLCSSLHIARRTISRSAGDPHEPHEAVSAAEFQDLRQRGEFALYWEANGHQYAVRHAELRPLERGLDVLLNGSRRFLPEARQKYPGLFTAHVTVPPHILRARLLARGRETPEAIEARLMRSAQLAAVVGKPDVDLVNDGAPEDAARKLLQHLLTLLPNGNLRPE
jgi:ribose 1,5-bisphosphokinase